MINLSQKFRDDEQSSAEIHQRIEMVLRILVDIEIEKERFHIQQGKCLEWSQLEKFLDLINKGEYYLQELERRIQ